MKNKKQRKNVWRISISSRRTLDGWTSPKVGLTSNINEVHEGENTFARRTIKATRHIKYKTTSGKKKIASIIICPAIILMDQMATA